MQNVCTRGKGRTFYVKKDIPSDVRHAFGGKAQVWRSLGTADKGEALPKAAAILTELDARIAAARVSTTALASSVVEVLNVPSVSPARPAVRREQLLDAIDGWRIATIDAAQDAFFNGVADTFDDFGLEDMAHSERLYRLQQRKWSEIEGFDQRLIDALGTRGFAIAADHPALAHIRSDFGAAWHDVERFTRQFRQGKFDGWPEDVDDAPSVVLRAPGSAVTSVSAPVEKLTLGELAERYIVSKRPPDATAVRGYVRRLSEALDMPHAHEVTAAQMDAFAVDLRRFPIIKRPALDKLPFRKVLDWQARNPGARLLSKKTQWKWFLAYKKLFDYAASVGLIASNPVAPVMPKAKGEEEERLAYDAWKMVRLRPGAREGRAAGKPDSPRRSQPRWACVLVGREGDLEGGAKFPKCETVGDAFEPRASPGKPASSSHSRSLKGRWGDAAYPDRAGPAARIPVATRRRAVGGMACRPMAVR